MDEAQFIETNGQQEEVAAGQEVETKKDEGPQLNEIEQKAFDQGWRPKEEFEGPEENWKSANQYVSDGEWLGKIKELNQRMDKQQGEFDSRLENANKLNEVRRQSEIDELKSVQREAVGVADQQGYDDAQTKINKLEDQAEVADNTPARDPELVAWETANPWVMDTKNEKASIANSIFTTYADQNPNSTMEQALKHVDDRLATLYPATTTSNPRRDTPNATENTSSKPRRAANKELTMGDLTPQEQSEWQTHGKMMFKTEKAYLKAVADVRKK